MAIMPDARYIESMASPAFDPLKVDTLIRETAAVEIVPRFQNLAIGDIREKGPGNLVTIADEAAERHLTEGLAALLPGSLVVGEEAVAADPHVLARLDTNESIWIIDPIDGTANYAAGRPIFAVMIALVRHDETMAAWIYDPIAGEMLSALKGEGARLNGNPVHVASPVPVAEMKGALSYRTIQDEQRRKELRGRYLFHGDKDDFHCAGREYIELARGARHFTNFHRLMPWDHAPGIFLHSEAGGFSAMVDDETPYRPSRVSGPLLAAPDRESWQELRQVIFGETDHRERGT